MFKVVNIVTVATVLVSNLHIVFSASCYCTAHDYVVPIWKESAGTKETPFTHLQNRCFTGRIHGIQFCPENQNFCLKLESLYPTTCDKTSPIDSDAVVIDGVHRYQKRQADVRWGSWTLWTECAASGCGANGIKTRERNCTLEPSVGQCFGDKVQLTVCVKICVQSTVPPTIAWATWSGWSVWSKCDFVSCNSSTRTRQCPSPNPASCAGNDTDQKSCAVDGGFSGWETWGSCQPAAGQLYKRRQRQCNNPAPLCGGKCHGRQFDVLPCAEVVHWLSWADWSTCMKAAGADLFLRDRQCEKQDRDCSGRGLEYKFCPERAVVIWDPWSPCSATCDQGVQRRKGLCVDSVNLQLVDKSLCHETLNESKDCNLGNCPGSNMPIWADWSAWSACDPPCNTGLSTRIRFCIDASACSGNQSESIPCSQNLCKVNGNWSTWEEWNQCKPVGGYNLIVRYRQCTNPPPKNTGKNCDGLGFDIDACKFGSYWSEWFSNRGCQKIQEYNTTGVRHRNRTCHIGLSNDLCPGDFDEYLTCTLHGIWSKWDSWSGCSTTCGAGVKQRSRHCLDLANPECVGNATDNQSCKEIEHCAVDGHFSFWSAWSDCQVTCGVGPKVRNRKCNNPRPQFGGKNCNGTFTDTDLCSTQDCPVDGHWTDWGVWHACSVSCGNGTKIRERTCTNPPPSSGGHDCEGTSKNTDTCNEGICSVDGDWSTWGTWTHCTCQNIHVRERKCDNPPPVANGADCVGNVTQEASCTPDNSLNCPINGGWTDWGQWGTVCSTTCGQGVVARTRQCSNPTPAFGGANCSGDKSQNKDCNIQPCAVDGSWSSWSGWSHCDVTCENGSQSRTRTCTQPPPVHGGKDCQGEKTDSKNCSLRHCPIDGAWSDWKAWSSWDVTCAHASRLRTRNCTNPPPMFHGHPCPGDENDYESKELVKCPVDGGWSEWSRWFGCSVTCGPGINSRYRTCDNPVPAFHGKGCPPADFRETKTCNDIGCPIDGSWADWGAWGGCSVTCGNGTRAKIRTCTNPPPKYHGKTCLGQSRDNKDCDAGYCPIDGAWSTWDPWQSCSVTCGDGFRLRNRLCDNPAPKYNGSSCIGLSIGNGSCNDAHCPVDGSWGSWQEWEKCSTTCGDGTQLRHRQCNNPSPQYGGVNCSGSGEESGFCNVKHCPVDGNWGSWERWSPCAGGCPSATKQRFRPCNNPAPLYDGSYCSGSGIETTNCLPQSCIVDGSWGAWLEWEKCSTTCGDGTKLRHRNCDNPVPQYGGVNCSGTNEESGVCNVTHCPVNGQWGTWVPWSRCFGGCSTGTRQRFRPCNNPEPLYGGDFCSGSQSETEKCLPSNCTASTLKTFNDAPDTTPVTNFKCYTCDPSKPESCVDVDTEETCGEPYCINELTHFVNGTKLVSRRCGTKDECDRDWWNSTRHEEKCIMYESNQPTTSYVHCTFCCVGDLCNDQVIPPSKSLYKPENH